VFISEVFLKRIVEMQLRILAPDAHFNQPAKLIRSRQNVSNEKCSHLTLTVLLLQPRKLEVSFVALSNGFVDAALVRLIPFVHNAFSDFLQTFKFLSAKIADGRPIPACTH